MAIAFVAVLVVSAAGVWYAANALLNREVPPPETGLHLRLRIVGSDWQTYYETNESRNNTAFSLLLEAAKTLNISVTWTGYTVPEGIFVDSIGGDANGEGEKWWQFWVNGEYAMIGADKAELKDGDLVEWRFGPFGP